LEQTVDYASLAARLGVDLVALACVIWLLLHRRAGRSDMFSLLVVLNIGLFAVVQVITTTEFGIGAGFGLFAVLSIIRLRSALFVNLHLAFVFSCLALALVTGVPGVPVTLSAALAVLVVVATAAVVVGERSRPTNSCTVTLDMARGDDAGLVSELERRLGVRIVDVSLVDVDFVRDTTTVKVRHRTSAVVEVADDDPRQTP
jgi:hypothetical protein